MKANLWLTLIYAIIPFLPHYSSRKRQGSIRENDMGQLLSVVPLIDALRSRGEIGKTTDFVRRNIADMQKSFE